MFSRVLRWFVSFPASIFYCAVAISIHMEVGEPSGPAAIARFVADSLLGSGIALWVVADARKRGRPTPYEFDWLVYFLLPILAPLHLFATRGWRAFITLAWFVLLMVAGSETGALLARLRQY